MQFIWIYVHMLYFLHNEIYWRINESKALVFKMQIDGSTYTMTSLEFRIFSEVISLKQRILQGTCIIINF